MHKNESARLFKKALKLMPGGVNSPVRSFSAVGGTPLFIKSGKGAIITDVDRNQYIDYVGSWGPMILGHAFPKVVSALKKTVNRSTSFGAPTESEIRLADLIIRMVPGLERIRMVNSGTEACMSVLRLARAFTKKNKIIKFEGCYHGHADSFLIQAGSGVTSLGIAGSAGVPEGVVMDTCIARYNDIQSVSEIIKKHTGHIAAVIIEPVAGNMGCIPPKKDFLSELRKLCDLEGALLIFDEVMTGFRIAPGGAIELYNVQPDLVTYGKIIGGGLPVGAYGGKEKIMNMIAPAGPVYQAGTLSGNPLAMAAGFTVLEKLFKNKSIYKNLESKGQYLENGLAKSLKESGIAFQINRVGSMMSLHFTESPVVDLASARKSDKDKFKRFFHSILSLGIYWPPSNFESIFISNAHTIRHLDKTIGIVKKVMKYIK